MTLADIIELYSEFKVGSAATDDITDAQLATLKTNADVRLARIVGSRNFASSETEEMEAYLVLDVLTNRAGKGVLVKDSVKDASWEVQKINSTSSWMDLLNKKIEEYDKAMNIGIDLMSSGDLEAGVRRNDDLIPELMDGYIVPDEEKGW